MYLKCLLPVELDHIQTIQGTPDLSFAVAKYKDIYWNLFQHTSPPPYTHRNSSTYRSITFLTFQQFRLDYPLVPNSVVCGGGSLST